jgi:hypothetical protein
VCDSVCTQSVQFGLVEQCLLVCVTVCEIVCDSVCSPSVQCGLVEWCVCVSVTICVSVCVDTTDILVPDEILRFFSV